MPDYRAYTVGADGHFTGFKAFVCDDDAAAIESAKRPVNGCDVELWAGARLVVILQHTSDRVRSYDRQIEESERMSKNAADAAGSARMDQLTKDLRSEQSEQKHNDEKK